ncbi:MAG: hypothetical protein NVS1B4_02450 [Gemmatimonadaceae bacterium]
MTADGYPAGSADRRQNALLREQLDELLALVRQLARNAATMPVPDLQQAQDRLEWLAGEIWRTIALSPPNQDRL